MSTITKQDLTDVANKIVKQLTALTKRIAHLEKEVTRLANKSAQAGRPKQRSEYNIFVKLLHQKATAISNERVRSGDEHSKPLGIVGELWTGYRKLCTDSPRSRIVKKVKEHIATINKMYADGVVKQEVDDTARNIGVELIDINITPIAKQPPTSDGDSEPEVVPDVPEEAAFVKPSRRARGGRRSRTKNT